MSARNLAPEMREQDHDERIRGVAMQAAHDAAQIPLLAGQRLHGTVRARSAGIEERVDIDARRRNDPVEKEAQRAQVMPWIRRAERRAEAALDPEQQRASPHISPGRSECWSDVQSDHGFFYS